MATIANTLREYAAQLKDEAAGKPSQVPDDHVPTEAELNNIAYMSMRYLVSWPLRSSDFQIIMHLVGKVKCMSDIEDVFIPVLAEYIWNHLMGEPRMPTVDDVKLASSAFAALVYTMDEETRNSTGPVVYENSDQVKVFYDQVKDQIPETVKQDIADSVKSMEGKTGYSAKAVLGEFILNYCGEDKDRGRKMLEEASVSYDQTHISFVDVYKDTFLAEFGDYLTRMLSFIWLNLQE